MFKNLLLFFALIIVSAASGQNVFIADITDAATGEPLMGVNVILRGTADGAVSNVEGRVILENVPDGGQSFLFSFLGYEEQEQTYFFPVEEGTVFEIKLLPQSEEMEEVIIASTRSRRTIADLPTRVEAISGEELEEKGNM